MTYASSFLIRPFLKLEIKPVLQTQLTNNWSLCSKSVKYYKSCNSKDTASSVGKPFPWICHSCAGTHSRISFKYQGLKHLL